MEGWGWWNRRLEQHRRWRRSHTHESSSLELRVLRRIGHFQIIREQGLDYPSKQVVEIEKSHTWKLEWNGIFPGKKTGKMAAFWTQQRKNSWAEQLKLNVMKGPYEKAHKKWRGTFMFAFHFQIIRVQNWRIVKNGSWKCLRERAISGSSNGESLYFEGGSNFYRFWCRLWRRYRRWPPHKHG